MAELTFQECKTHNEIYVSNRDLSVGTIKQMDYGGLVTVFQFQSEPDEDNYPLRYSLHAAKFDAMAHDAERKVRATIPDTISTVSQFT
tara:strand:+ start:3342 stop:3605 length:264 start_codon:yes stop_codon:yes gene_type:complete